MTLAGNILLGVEVMGGVLTAFGNFEMTLRSATQFKGNRWRVFVISTFGFRTQAYSVAA